MKRHIIIICFIFLFGVSCASAFESNSDTANRLRNAFDELCTEFIYYGTPGYYPNGIIFQENELWVEAADDRSFVTQAGTFLKVQSRLDGHVYYTRHFILNRREDGLLAVDTEYVILPEISVSESWFIAKNGPPLEIVGESGRTPLIFYKPLGNDSRTENFLFFLFDEVEKVEPSWSIIGKTEALSDVYLSELAQRFHTLVSEINRSLSEQDATDLKEFFVNRLYSQNTENFEFFRSHFEVRNIPLPADK